MHFADGITITTLVENYVDMLIPNTERVKRPGLAFHFDPRNKPIQAENGISLLVDIAFAGQNYRILFDAGLSDSVILHNMSALKISPDIIDHAVISHGHPDHYGGLLAVLKARSVPLPVIIHPNAFLTRYVVAGKRLGDSLLQPVAAQRGIGSGRREAGAGGQSRTDGAGRVHHGRNSAQDTFRTPRTACGNPVQSQVP